MDGNVASNERQTRTCHRVLRCAQLFPQFVHVIRMDLLKERAAKPLGLQLVQNGSDRVRHVDNTTRLSRHHEQESVSRLQNQVLQFLWQQTEGFKWCFKDFKSTFFVCILSFFFLHLAKVCYIWHIYPVKPDIKKKNTILVCIDQFIKIQNKFAFVFFLEHRICNIRL